MQPLYAHARRIAVACSVPALLLLPTLTYAQLTRGDQVPEINVLRVLLALVFCLGLAVAIIWWLKKGSTQRFKFLTAPATASALRVVQSARLNNRATLYVVEFDGQRLLVGADPSGLVRLAQSGPLLGPAVTSLATPAAPGDSAVAESTAQSAATSLSEAVR